MASVNLFSLSFDPHTWHVGADAHPGVIAAAILIVVGGVIAHIVRSGAPFEQMEIDEAEFGIGDAKFTLKPNWTDRQVAYAIWVELATRKIGLRVDFDNDVIADVYQSWYDFFSVTRDLVKTIPISRVTDKSTSKIIRLSIEILNEGLRPHLTRWQARFKHWYATELEKVPEDFEDPQAIQRRYPQWDALTEDMAEVNKHLIHYRAAMQRIVYSKYGSKAADAIEAADPIPPQPD